MGEMAICAPLAKNSPKGRRVVIEGLSINGIWPASLPVAVAVVLLTILAVRVFGGGPKRHDPSHHVDRSQGRDGPNDHGQALEDGNIRAGLAIKASHFTRGTNESRVLSRRPTPASGSASTMAVLPQNHELSGDHK